MKEVTLQDAQELTMTILRDFDEICKKNNLEYWVDYGTLLGTIRHKGFIPWDDDIDVGMLREDYNKFIKIASEELPDDLLLQNIESDEHVEYQWAKIRHKYSLILEEDSPKYQSGMFIDVFPFDFYDSEVDIRDFRERKKYIKNYKAIYNANLKFEKSFKKNIKRLGCKILKNTILRKNLRDLIIEEKEKIDIKRNKKKFIGLGREVFYDLKLIDYEMMFPLKRAKFGNIEVNIPREYDKYLEQTYGSDYMEIPKEKDRYAHNQGLFIGKKRG